MARRSSIRLHQGGSQMPVAALVLVLKVLRTQAIDERHDLLEVSPLMPCLEAFVDDGAEVQIPIAFERDQVLDVPQFHGLAAVAEQ